MKILNMRVVVLTSFLLFATPLCAQKTDVVVMKNGDHLTCEVTGLTAGVLRVKLDYVDGAMSVQWSQVARVESKRLLIVKTQDGSVYSGRISTAEPSADNAVKIKVGETAEKATVIESSKIIAIDRTSEKFLQRFNGDISLGLIYSIRLLRGSFPVKSDSYPPF